MVARNRPLCQPALPKNETSIIKFWTISNIVIKISIIISSIWGICSAVPLYLNVSFSNIYFINLKSMNGMEEQLCKQNQIYIIFTHIWGFQVHKKWNNFLFQNV